jgi:2-polyprenyl-3-methyl-5-hydroxy-6-metoxy-1,4-benzoquinol methylase
VERLTHGTNAGIVDRVEPVDNIALRSVMLVRDMHCTTEGRGRAPMDEYLNINRETWNTWTRLNVASEFYNVEGFKAGRRTLDPIVLAGPGDVTGKSLLHLQCHFGMDTLSWARRGAIVTGIDFSDRPSRSSSRAHSRTP